jgi:prevent-host-death family protein
MRMVNIHEAKTHLSRLLEEAARGEDIVIAKAGKPVARLVPYTDARPRRRLGALRGKLAASDRFDAPLPDAILDSFGSS